MDMLFEARVSARKFTETSVDSFVTAGGVDKEGFGDADLKMASEHVDKVQK
jgi:hypothetical protein